MAAMMILVSAVALSIYSFTYVPERRTNLLEDVQNTLKTEEKKYNSDVYAIAKMSEKSDKLNDLNQRFKEDVLRNAHYEDSIVLILTKNGDLIDGNITEDYSTEDRVWTTTIEGRLDLSTVAVGYLPGRKPDVKSAISLLSTSDFNDSAYNDIYINFKYNGTKYIGSIRKSKGIQEETIYVLYGDPVSRHLMSIYLFFILGAVVILLVVLLAYLAARTLNKDANREEEAITEALVKNQELKSQFTIYAKLEEVPEGFTWHGSRVIADTMNTDLRQMRGMVTKLLGFLPQKTVISLYRGEKLGIQRLKMLPLFMDIASFTSVSENISSEELTVNMNNFYNTMSNILKQCDEEVTLKYDADSIIGLFRAYDDPLENEKALFQLFLAVNSMKKEFEKGKAEGRWIFNGIRIGFGYGYVHYGLIGSTDIKCQVDFLGDTGNLSSRLEGANKQFQTIILFMKSIADSLSSKKIKELQDMGIALSFVGRLIVKGKAEPVEVMTITDLSELPLERYTAAKKFFESGLKLMEDARKLSGQRKQTALAAAAVNMQIAYEDLPYASKYLEMLLDEPIVLKADFVDEIHASASPERTIRQYLRETATPIPVKTLPKTWIDTGSIVLETK